MGYAFYEIAGDRYGESRWGGYGVLATCDKRGCGAEIDRGLGCLCGSEPHGPLDDSPGCGRYFCDDHLGGVSDRGGCRHRQTRAWGLTLACLVQSPEGVYCLTRTEHDGPHAWEAAE